MAHFAELNLNNVVLRVVVVNNKELLNRNGVEEESKGADFCKMLFGGTWVQTSYNGSFRKNFASCGDVYDATRNAFIAPQPYASWLLNEDTCIWEAPIQLPDDNKIYEWDEHNIAWVEVATNE